MEELLLPWGQEELRVALPETWRVERVAEPSLRPAATNWQDRIAESLAQLGGLVLGASGADGAGEAPPGAWVLAEIRNLRFRRPVLPGDQLVLKVELDKSLGAASRLSGKALVDDDVVAEGEFTLSRTEGGPSD